MGYASTKGKKLECFKCRAKKYFYKHFENLFNSLCGKAMWVFLSHAGSLYVDTTNHEIED
jgi:hypothetical protein